jgi:hypothetical protein
VKLRLIDAFFASVRIVTGLDTGYAQLLTRPIGWGFLVQGDFSPINRLGESRMFSSLAGTGRLARLKLCYDSNTRPDRSRRGG